MAEDRITQLIAAGVAKDPDDFKPEAVVVINALTIQEFNSLLSTRAKVLAHAGEQRQKDYDHCITNGI